MDFDKTQTLTYKEIFTQSLMRCSNHETFIPAFYERFVSSSPHVIEKFRHTAFEDQYAVLLESLQLCAGAANGEAAALAEIAERAKTHDRNHLNIQPELYDLWLEALIFTARSYDPEWDTDIEAAWFTILDYVIQRMKTSY